MAEPRPLILTLALEPALAAPLNALRARHFPPERNFLAAHVTLFHALPGDQEGRVRGDLEDVCRNTPTFTVELPRVRNWGKGVFAELESAELLRFRERLADRWGGLLTPQDRRTFRPHVTVQNKVPEAEAKTLYNALAPTWQPLSGGATGASLWRYVGGPWEPLGTFSFGRRA